MPQRVAITGASGLIGGALSAYLTDRGDEVVHLVRRTPRRPHEVRWAPERHELDPSVLRDVDAVVNLAGAGIGDRRWTPAYKRLLRESRVATTTTVAEAIAAAEHPIRLVNASAIGFYGDRGEEALDETSPAGTGFLSDLVMEWEAATGSLQAAGHSVALARTGLVFSPHGGALGRLLPLARLGLAGPLGSGRQWWSWISLVDEVRALAHLVDHPQLRGPFNLVGPAPARQRDVVRALGRLLGRPALLPAPRPALRIALGEFAGDILASQRVAGTRLTDSGFTWRHPDLDAALRHVLDR